MKNIINSCFALVALMSVACASQVTQIPSASPAPTHIQEDEIAAAVPRHTDVVEFSELTAPEERHEKQSHDVIATDSTRMGKKYTHSDIEGRKMRQAHLDTTVRFDLK